MFNKINSYFQGVFNEAKKVTWPSQKEVKNHTIVVIATILVATVFFGLVDFGFSKVLELLLK
jgi:preprotein translocase subunit SecE